MREAEEDTRRPSQDVRETVVPNTDARCAQLSADDFECAARSNRSQARAQGTRVARHGPDHAPLRRCVVCGE